MKNSGVCPKCNSDDLSRIGGGSRIGRGVAMGACLFGFMDPLTRFVCNECGYSEEWFSGETLKKIKGRYGGNS